MRQQRNYVQESHELGKSYASMSRETGISVYKLKQNKIGYEQSRNLYRRSAYAYAKEHGFSTLEANLVRRGTYHGNKLSTPEDIIHGNKRTLSLKDTWYDRTAAFMLEKWNRENELKYQRRLEKYNSMTKEQQQAYRNTYGGKPKYHKYTLKQIRKILSDKLGDYDQEEWEYKLTQT